MGSISTNNTLPPGVQVLGPVTTREQSVIFSNEALSFVALLHRTFDARRKELLTSRDERLAQLDQGALLDFLPETASIRQDATWAGPPPAPGLMDRRVEITGPTDRKMVINALNSDVKTFMADFEDSLTPTWNNIINGQVNLYDAVRRTITLSTAAKEYKLREDRPLPTLIVRPRGWHLDENHITVDSQSVAGAILDFGLYFFHNATETVACGHGPYFYLPKLESYLEARLWNDIFKLSQDHIGMPQGTIRATVLIETINAAFEMDEIIYELRAHSSGLNCGRWDYIFSTIKQFRYNPRFLLPDRSQVTMTVPFMAAYVRLLIHTCHKRGVHAMGGMAAQIPIKNDPEANDAALARVKADKLREVKAGHDGTWVAHPALAPIATEVFNTHMPGPNQLSAHRDDVVSVSQHDLLDTNIPHSAVTDEGVRTNIAASLGYCASWLAGQGAVPIMNLMEDAATAEVSRSQVWQWVYHGVTTKEGNQVSAEFVLALLGSEKQKLLSQAAKTNLGCSPQTVERAAEYLAGQLVGKDYAGFLTTLMIDEVAKSQTM